MMLLGLDLNASRVRAVRGPLGEYPATLPLEGQQAELPLAVCLRDQAPTVGSSALAECRRLPHRVNRHFLPRLGAAPSNLGRRPPLDSEQAFRLICKQLESNWRHGEGVMLAAPAYLTAQQLDHLMMLLDESRVPWVGSVAAPLAAVLAAFAEQTWVGAAVHLDVDEHALTLAAVGTVDGEAQLLDLQCFTQLGFDAWRERLLNAIADVCILESRWDPRADADAEQGLYDQLDHLLDSSRAGLMPRLVLKTSRRFHNLVLQPGDASTFCSSLTRQVVGQVQRLFSGPWPEGAPRVVLVSAAAARLPGLLPALQAGLAQWGPDSGREPLETNSDDFGEDLLNEDEDETPSLVVLSADATARGAHSVAACFLRGDLPRGHLEIAAPLPLPQPHEAGPPRLNFKGQVFFLNGLSFTLGRQQGCDLVFDGDVYPSVSTRHCEITFDHRAYVVHDRSRDGTFINDCPAAGSVPLRPGDWIRLGPEGPMLRFLGQADHLRLVTTA